MKLPRRRFLNLAAGAAALPAVSRIAWAQTNYPERAIRIIGGFPAGGIPDVVGRVLGDKFSETWGKPVIVEMLTGAGGNIAGERVAKSAPDGYTLLMAAAGQIVINPSLYERMSYDPVKALAPISIAVLTPNVLVVGNDVPAKNAQELIAQCRAQPGKFTFGSAGVGTPAHLAGEMFKSMAHLDIQHVPYRGIPPLLPDLIAGRITMAFPPMAAVLSLVRDGKLRALAATTSQRIESAPELPTLAESGLPGFNAAAWFGLMAPSGTSPAIIEMLHRETVRVLALPDTRNQLVGVEVVADSPTEFSTIIKSESSQWAKVIKDGNIKPD